MAGLIDMTEVLSFSGSAGRMTAVTLCAACAILATSLVALAQQDAAPAPVPAPAQAAPPADNPPPATRDKPGLIDALGRWFSKSATDFNSGVRNMGGTISDFGKKTGEAAKDATEALTKLPGARVVEGRERCEIAANGAPDCRAAAEAVCKRKGFASGQSLDTQVTQKCSPRVWLSGRQPQEGECPVETSVTRAVCQ